MASNEESLNQEPVDIDEALNEEASRELAAMVAEVEQSSTATDEESTDDALLSAPQSQAERAGVIEALIFVSDEPLTVKNIADVLKEDKEVIGEAVKTLAEEFNGRRGLSITNTCARF
jgi:lipopolysaccharide biosynthesis regulator YciM